ncbi:nuclear transcription factor Y subunit C-4 isoform X2 [Ziziphus jujuba]|uniref:Nuclear transcription factor Y subunit C-4 isoform X2 n=1 Tax=Ziziphus jujuba TaxID=326968 RepID=A0ABM3IGW0_ZIZJJ|nr:nuclear transcription factor Y subunit C-4 isoform X2 [Ziziphus jujuba]
MNPSRNFRSSNPNHRNPNVLPMGSLMLPYPPPLTTNIEDAEESSESQFDQLQKHNLELFWNQQNYEMRNVVKSQNQLPLARIKRVMKSDGDVKMISSETPILFSKACELFIMELTLRAWMQTEGCKRRTLQRGDIARAIRSDELLDFLVDVVPLEEEEDQKLEEEAGQNSGGNEQPAAVEPLNFPDQANGDTEMANTMVQGVPQQFMYDPSVNSAQLQFNYPPK